MAKRIFFVVAFLINLVLVQAQDKRLYFAPYTTWDYSNIPYSSVFPHRGKLALGLGVQTNIRLSKRIESIIGVAYIDKGYVTKRSNIEYTHGFQPRVNRWWYAYISFPIKIQYNFKIKNKKMHVGGGIENDFNFDGNGHYIFNDFAQSVTLNFGINNSISQKLLLRIEPTIRKSIRTYGTKNYNQSSRPDLKPYSIGIKVLFIKVS
jgi:hypothetical protein